MSIELGFGLNDIKDFLLTNDGIVEYHELVKHFRHFLSDPMTQNEARNAFKDYVNRLATVCSQQNRKFLVLRPEFAEQIQRKASEVLALNRTDSLNSVGLPLGREPPIGLPSVDTRRTHQPIPQIQAIPQMNHEFRPNESMIANKQRSNSGAGHYPIGATSAHFAMGATTGHCPTSPSRTFSFSHHNNSFSDESDVPPQPPPRRRNSAAGAKAKPKLEERLKHFDDEKKGEKYSEDTQKDSLSHQIEKLKEIHELSTQTPGRVKERAQKIDKMASLTELKPPMPANNATTPTSRPKSRTGTVRENDDTDSGSLQVLDPLRRKWIISASNCDYNSLVLCLKEEPKLSAYKDFTNGYTALHWAAKFNKPEIVKLIAGTYGVDPNLKSHGGYTPLHLAAISTNEKVMELLIKTYQADPNIRDNSGKRPAQYLAKKVNQKSSSGKHSNGLISTQPHNNFGPTLSHKSIAARISSAESSSSFIRIGSLKAASKVKKITGIGPKSWGSVESIPENNLNKKSKKNKKNSKTFPTPERLKDSDSDSAYGFQ